MNRPLTGQFQLGSAREPRVDEATAHLPDQIRERNPEERHEDGLVRAPPPDHVEGLIGNPEQNGENDYQHHSHPHGADRLPRLVERVSP